MNMTDHLMLTCIIGAVVIGVGTGIVIRSQATTGGSDIVGMLLQKYAHIRFSRAILLVDGAVVCFGLVVIGFGLGTLSRFLVKDTGRMPQSSCFFSRFETLSFTGMDVQQFRPLHVLYFFQNLCQGSNIMSVHRTEITDIQSLKDVLLLHQHGL